MSFFSIFPAFEAPFNCFCNGKGLRQGETYRGVNAHAAVGRLLDGLNSRGRNRYLDDHIWSQTGKMLGLFKDGFGIAIKLWVGLDGQPPIPAIFALENGQ